MILKKSQVLALLVAAIAFCLAFMAAGVLLLSAVFMLAGLAVTFWVTRSLIVDVRRRRLDRPA